MTEKRDGNGSNASDVAERLRTDGGTPANRIGRQAAWIVVVLAVGGLALGLVPMVYGSFGEDQIDTPGSSDRDLTDEEETALDAQFKNQAIQLIVTIVPYLAVPLGIGLGFAVGTVGSGRPQDLAVGVGIGTFVGVVAFVFLSSAVAMQQWWAIESGFGSGQQWLQWDSTIKNAALVALPTALLSPVAAVAGAELRS